VIRVVSILVLALLAVMPARAQTDVTFFLTFVPNIQFSPLYVAIDKGYFADEGIALTIQHGDEPDGVNLIAADQLKFGMISGEQVIQARANERPVVYVYEWFQEYPVGVVVAADSDITEVTDLTGRVLGIPGRFGASYSGLIALLAANDMAEADVQLEPIGFNAPEVFCVGAVEASVVYINNEPLQIANRAAAGDCEDVNGVRVLPVAEAADMVSNGIVTNEVTIAEQPELVEALVRAFDRGLRDVIQNPAEAYLISRNYVETLPLSAELEMALRAEAEAQVALLTTDPTRAELADSRDQMLARLLTDFEAAELLQFEVLLETIELTNAERLGVTEPESWTLTQDVLLDMGFIEAEIDLDGVYTNDFLPEMAAGNADVTYVRAVQTGDNTWTFHVTVAHPDTGWEDYADGWDVVTPDGMVLKPDPDSPFTRLLLHPHVEEQPFTRSQSGITIPEEVTQVTVRAHDLVDGFGGREIVVDLTTSGSDDYEVERQ
jgi:NitT/TauT family transport system substrate-binding protein